MHRFTCIFFTVFLLFPQAARPQAAGGPTSLLNPGISVIGDLRAGYADRGSRRAELAFEEAEFAFLSSIDPYARADIFVAFHRDEDGEFHPEIEEAYVTTLSLPLDLRLRAGRFRLPVGRLNTVHPHTLPFADHPAPVEAFLGDEGLIDDAIGAGWLIPNPFGFYQELELCAASGPAEHPLFARSPSARYLLAGHLKNFWDLDENTTLQLGVSGLNGPNEEEGTTLLGAVDLTLRWKPLRLNRYRSLTWQTEIFRARYGMPGGDPVSSLGAYSFLTWQVGERWFLTGRADYADDPRQPGAVTRAGSATIGWHASEFQKLELGGRIAGGNDAQGSMDAVLRWIFVIGAHTAHTY